MQRDPLVVLLVLVGSTLGVFAGRSVLPSSAAPRLAAPLVPVGSGFTYQGQLLVSSNPTTGAYDFIFTLYDAAIGGNVVAAALNPTNVAVTNGLFTVTLDFGSATYYGEVRWLDIQVRPAGPGGYTSLSPRQALTATPFASSAPWSGVASKPWLYSQTVPGTFILNAAVDGDSNNVTSATIGADGLGLISHYAGNSLRVIHCNNLACTNSTISTVDNTGNVGAHSSLTIGADGLGLIAYQDITNGSPNGHLKVAHCNNVACSSAITATIDLSSGVGSDTSVTIGTDGFGLISYYDYTTPRLKVVHCTNSACSTHDPPTTLDPTNPAGVLTSITLGSDGLGLISYGDAAGELKVAHCTNPACSAATYTLIESSIGGYPYTSITIGVDGLGLISYRNSTTNQVKVLHCTNIPCTSSDTPVVLNTLSGTTYDPTPLAIGMDGLPIVSYWALPGVQGQLWVSHCLKPDCSPIGGQSAISFVLDSGATSLGQSASLTIGADGLPLISYYDGASHMNIIHCPSTTCVNRQHRR